MSEKPPFGGFHFTSRHFYVTATNLSISRGWSHSPLIGSKAGSEFSVSIMATAVGTHDDVCIIGSFGMFKHSKEFQLRITSDTKAKDRWERLAALDILIDKEDDTPERRIKNRIREILKESPPTATLFLLEQDKESDIDESWNLECQIPEGVLEQLLTDIAAGQADTVAIGIEWTAGLVRDEYTPYNYPTTWGMFRLSAEAAPEPLHGHVSVFNWRLTTGRSRRADGPSNEQFAREIAKWAEPIEDLRKAKEEPWVARSAPLLDGMARNISNWCGEHRVSPDRLRGMLNEATQFIKSLDEALHQENGPFAKDYGLWSHRNIVRIFGTTKPSQREEFVGVSELDGLVTEYLEKPWLHNPHLDWVILDVLVSLKMVSNFDLYMQEKHGVAYSIFANSPWKMLACKLVLKPLSFLLNWALPAVVCYFIVRWSLWVGVGIGVAYYGFSLWMLGLRIWSRVGAFLSRKPTRLQLIEDAEKIYGLLAGSVLHLGTIRKAFERSMENGVSWDPRIFCICDHVAARGPELWRMRADRDFFS